MNILAVLLFTVLSSASPEKPQFFERGTSLTLDFGFQGGGIHTPDGPRIGVGVLTSLKGNINWAYELSIVNGDDCHHDYCYDEWGIYLYGGINRYFFFTPDRRFYAILGGGLFAGINSFERGYWYNEYDNWDDDDTALVVGPMGKASIMFDIKPVSLGVTLFLGFGISFGTESGLEFTLPGGLSFSIHWAF